MFALSKAISAAKLRQYFRAEFSSVSLSYYSQDNELKGEWIGTLAAEMGLVGHVNDVMYDRLTEGRDPFTGALLIGHTASHNGSMEHRAGWDLVFSPSKTISLTALPGGDVQIREFHRQAVREAFTFLENSIQARMGGNMPALTTGKAIAAMFEHDAARPVNGYSAPLLHTHIALFNMTAADGNGNPYSIDPRSLFSLQTATTAVYQNSMAYQLQRAGYEIDIGENHAPEIRGYSQDYVDAESQRNRIIREQLEKQGLKGAKAASIVAREQREEKLEITSEELQAMHKQKAAEFGNQPERVVAEAKSRAKTIHFEADLVPKKAVDFAISRLSERESVIERDGYKQRGGLVQNALQYRPGRYTLQSVQAEIERRKVITDEDRASGKHLPELVRVGHYRPNAPGERYATREMIALERQMIEHVIQHRGQYKPIAAKLTKDEFRLAHAHHLNDNQMHMIWKAMHSHDQVFGVQGAAGVGKSFSMGLFAEIARDHGYTVKGLAPISGAVQELAKVGIQSETLAKHVRRTKAIENKEMRRRTREPNRTLYLIDETSLTGTKSAHYFLTHLKPTDRVLIIGDRRQHDPIEAGKAFGQLQDAGMYTIPLNKIMRQRENPELLQAVKHFHNGQIREGLAQLKAMDAIVQHESRYDRYAAIAEKLSEDLARTIVVSPDNQSRKEINRAVREKLHETNVLSQNEISNHILVPRQDVTEADTRRALGYEVGNWIQAHRTDKRSGVSSGEYLRIESRDAETNTITLRRAATNDLVTIEPTKTDLKPSIYMMEERSFAVGERVQFTAQWKPDGIANRTLGTIEALHGDTAAIRLDPAQGHQYGRLVDINLKKFDHLDYGYTMTSYSVQGQTKHTVLANIDTGDSTARSLLDKKMIYVMASRASHEFHIFTDNKIDLERVLSRIEPKPTALSREQTVEYRQQVVGLSAA